MSRCATVYPGGYRCENWANGTYGEFCGWHRPRLVIVEPERTLCRLCGLVWTTAKDGICPPHLRSEKEQRMVEKMREKIA